MPHAWQWLDLQPQPLQQLLVSQWKGFASFHKRNTSWWFQPLWKICSSNWIISPNRGENKKCLKPPPRIWLKEIRWNSCTSRWAFLFTLPQMNLVSLIRQRLEDDIFTFWDNYYLAHAAALFPGVSIWAYIPIHMFTQKIDPNNHTYPLVCPITWLAGISPFSVGSIHLHSWSIFQPAMLVDPGVYTTHS